MDGLTIRVVADQGSFVIIYAVVVAALETGQSPTWLRNQTPERAPWVGVFHDGSSQQKFWCSESPNTQKDDDMASSGICGRAFQARELPECSPVGNRNKEPGLPVAQDDR